MTARLDGTVALVTGASSGIGEATARQLADLGATVALVARRKDRLDALAQQIEADGGTALPIAADITDRAQAAAAVSAAVEQLGRVDILVNNAGLMLLGPVVDADPEEWDRMVDLNLKGLLYVTNAALPHLLAAAEQGPRRVADIVNVSSVAARQFYPVNGVYALTKAGLAAFNESLRQEITQRHVRVGLIEPGAVVTELYGHNRPEIKEIVPSPESMESLSADDLAESVVFMITRPRHVSVNDLWVGPTEQV